MPVAEYCLIVTGGLGGKAKQPEGETAAGTEALVQEVKEAVMKLVGVMVVEQESLAE